MKINCIRNDKLGQSVILILGNGFDKHVNLQSSFSDFFMSTILKDGKLSNDCSNLLYFLFYIRFFASDYPIGGFIRRLNKHSLNWMDVESFLQKIATDDKYHKSFYSAYSNYIHVGIEQLQATTSIDPKIKMIAIIMKRKNLPPFLGEEDLGDILKHDLKEFENDFNNYLVQSIAALNDYDKKRRDLIDRMLGACFNRQLGNLQIISFNYSTFVAENFSSANIHGVLNKNIVIGYDSTALNIKDGDYYSLSKEWQKMDVDYFIEITSAHYILMYGHSLGKQDYPFFFELFDNCNLLENKVLLFFCHSLKDDEFDNYRMNASKLIDAYDRKRLRDDRSTLLTRLKTNNLIKFIYID